MPPSADCTRVALQLGILLQLVTDLSSAAGVTVQIPALPNHQRVSSLREQWPTRLAYMI